MNSNNSLPAGLSTEDAAAKYQQYGPNTLPDVKTSSVLRIFFRQFLNPLIYILVVAAAVSLALGRIEDLIFIVIVLLINGATGTFHEHSGKVFVFVKGAVETLVKMASHMKAGDEKVPIFREKIQWQKDRLAARGLRVLAFAEGEIDAELLDGREQLPLVDLTFLGLVGMHDPVRSEVSEAISNCRSAGIDVVTITGDDPKTAGAIAKDAGLDYSPGEIATGDDVRRANEISREALDRLTSKARIYARVEPTQKLAIVVSLVRNGHFVAVTGDGVNDAPALKHAHVGVAMGDKGTEVARESADIILADDNFSSIVEGIRQGRVAYANIRKVIFLLISTGASEVVLFLLAVPLVFVSVLLLVVMELEKSWDNGRISNA